MQRHARTGLFFLAATFLAAGVVHSMQEVGIPNESGVFQPQDLFLLQFAASPAISPDGRLIAYERCFNDILTDRLRRDIWLVHVDSGDEEPIATGGDYGHPTWSPDATRIAYFSKPPEAPVELTIRWIKTGELTRVKNLVGSPRDVMWSPDGRSLAFIMRATEDPVTLGAGMAQPSGAVWAKPLQVMDRLVYRMDGKGYTPNGFEHVFLASADGTQLRQLTFGRADDVGPLSWTPDGSTILFSSARGTDWELDPSDSEVFAVDAASGAARPLTDRRGPDESPSASPDGKWIAYLGYDKRDLSYQHRHLYLMHSDGTGATPFDANLDLNIDKLAWAGDSRSMVVKFDAQGRGRLARVALDGRITPLATSLAGSVTDRPYSGGDFSLSSSGVIALTTSDAGRPADLSVLAKGRLRRLTTLNEFLGHRRRGRIQPLSVTAADGHDIPTWILTPPGFSGKERVPTILEIHGGPHAAYGPNFSSTYELYAAAGFAVLFANPRGSTSYGERFAQLIQYAYPGEDYGDLMSAVDAAVGAGIADPNDLFVTGGSGGGLLTSWIVGKTDRFKAAAAQKLVSNWASLALTTDSPEWSSPAWFRQFPWQAPLEYWQRSPLSLVDNIKTPTLIVVGAEDYRTPVEESDQFYRALKLRHVATALILVPDTGHDISDRPSQAAAETAAILSWFNKYRKN